MSDKNTKPNNSASVWPSVLESYLETRPHGAVSPSVFDFSGSVTAEGIEEVLLELKNLKLS